MPPLLRLRASPPALLRDAACPAQIAPLEQLAASSAVASLPSALASISASSPRQLARVRPPSNVGRLAARSPLGQCALLHPPSNRVWLPRGSKPAMVQLLLRRLPLPLTLSLPHLLCRLFALQLQLQPLPPSARACSGVPAASRAALYEAAPRWFSLRSLHGALVSLHAPPLSPVGWVLKRVVGCASRLCAPLRR